jgi:hypothetical protein
MKADFVALEFDGSNSGTGSEPELRTVIDGDLQSTGVKAKLTAGVHNQRAVSREGTAHERVAGARLRSVKEADTTDKVRVALTGVLLIGCL